MGEVALLAASVAIAQHQAQPQPLQAPPSLDAVVAASGALLGSWVAAARTAVVQGGLLSEEAMAALLAQWDWQPVLQQAALQLVPQRGGGSPAGAASMAEVRRAMQRSVRQLADLVRRGSH